MTVTEKNHLLQSNPSSLSSWSSTLSSCLTLVAAQDYRQNNQDRIGQGEGVVEGGYDPPNTTTNKTRDQCTASSSASDSLPLSHSKVEQILTAEPKKEGISGDIQEWIAPLVIMAILVIGYVGLGIMVYIVFCVFTLQVYCQKIRIVLTHFASLSPHYSPSGPRY